MTTNYRDAGVNIDAGEELVRRVKPFIKETFTPQVETDLGLFGGAFRMEMDDIKVPLLVSSTDGVGTKSLVAEWVGRYNTVGKDLVNHCVNDIFTCGAKPLFFLDYYATDSLDIEKTGEVIKGVAEACKENGIALLGGETAEMPQVYRDGVFDLAGTIVGVVDKAELINGRRIEAGDLIVGLPSSGLHTNGYSLARKVIIQDGGHKPNDQLEGLHRPIGEALLETHICYYPIVKPWLDAGLRIKGMAHITGGGIEGNVSRIIPDGLRAEIDWEAWEMPTLFRYLQESGEIPDEDMRRTFNLGIGWVMIISPERSKELIMRAIGSGTETYRIGVVSKA